MKTNTMMTKAFNAGSAAEKGSSLFALTICAEVQEIAFMAMEKRFAVYVKEMDTYDA